MKNKLVCKNGTILRVFNKSLLILFLALVSGYKTRSQIPRPVPPNYSAATTINYIRSWTASAPENSSTNLITRSVRDVKQTTQYFDVLGRPLQTVVKNGSLETSTGINVDFISATDYDPFGRETFKYPASPSTATDATKNDGRYKLDPFAEQAAFYGSASANAPLLNQGESFFYGQTNYELSPENRVQENFAAGNSWVGSASNSTENSRKSLKAKYYLNTTTDAVRFWTVADAAVGTFGGYQSPTTYVAGTLFKNISVNEANNQVIEFKDNEGKLILKKVQLTASADLGTGSGHDGWLCRYYIYDDFNNLRCIVQPHGVELISPSFVLSDLTILDQQCFRYEYDLRKRVTMKKAPGASETYMVYDALDRLVMTQDANLRANSNKWLVTLYDKLDRPVLTGLLSNTFDNVNNTFALKLVAANNGISYPFTITTIPSATFWDESSKTFYDNYLWLTSEGNPLPANRYTLDDALLLTSGTVYPYPQPLTQSSRTKGMATGTKTKIIGTSQYLYSTIYYDDRGRVLQTLSQKLTGTVSITNQYNFSGQLLASCQTTGSNLDGETVGIITKYDYDDLGRLLDVKKMVTTSFGPGATEKIVVQNQYDALGHLKTKKLSPAFNSNAGLETLKYDYNIRGWLLGMNRDYVKDVSTTNYFGFDLGYDKNGAIGNYNPLYTGNISGTIWKSVGDGQKRKYAFSYDVINRLMKADFTQQNGSLWDVSAKVDYSMRMGNGADPLTAYDANGNIQAMYEMGLNGTTSVPVEDLIYKYLPSSNCLKYVYDNVPSVGTKLGDFQESTLNYNDNTVSNIADYDYDPNGNLKSDKNKAISAITYNYLNLPNLVAITPNRTVAYNYDAGGNKVRKITTEPASATNNNIATTTTTDYIGGLIYESKIHVPASSADYTYKLQFGGQEEGRIRAVYGNTLTPNTITDFTYDYFIKDQVGNVRMILTDEVIIPDTYPNLSFEGTNGSAEVNNQNGIWEKADGTPFDVVGKRITSPANLTNATSLVPATLAYSLQVRSSTGKVGAGKLLKVMSGDKINTTIEYYYSSNTGSGAASGLNTLVSGFAAMLTSSIASTSVVKQNATVITSAINFDPNAGTFFTPQSGTNNGRPKAFLNVLFFNEQFKFDNINSYFEQISLTNPGQIVIALGTARKVKTNGYCYIYISNESDDMVYFDNFTLKHERGQLVEENHFYPFGLAMSGICSHAANKLENRYKFNGKELQSKEFSDGSGLELEDYGARLLDQQLGRWNSIDAFAGKMSNWSPYNYTFNNPVLLTDPTGNDPTNGMEAIWRSAGFIDFGGDNSYESVRWDLNSDLGQYYTDGRAFGDALRGALMLGSVMVGGMGAVVEGGFGAAVEDAVAAGASVEDINAVGVWDAKAAAIAETEAANASAATEAVNAQKAFQAEVAADQQQALQSLSNTNAFVDETSQSFKEMVSPKYAFGIRGNVEPWAEEIGANHLMGDPNWRGSYLDIINNPNSEIHFSLQGIDSRIIEMINDPFRGGINWEINQIYQSPAFNKTTFYYPTNNDIYTGSLFDIMPW